MRPPVDTSPPRLSPPTSMGQRRDAADGPAARPPVLLEFWDFCRARSLRTLPYVQAWHERYDGGPARGRAYTAPATRRARPRRVRAKPSRRLGIEHAVASTRVRAVERLRQRGVAGALPVRRQSRLSIHYGEGAYEETEAEVRSCSRPRARRGAAAPPGRPDAMIAAPTPEQVGAYRGRLRGRRRVGRAGRASGVVRVARARESRSPIPARTRSLEHEHNVQGELDLELGVRRRTRATPRASRRGGGGALVEALG